MFKLFQFFLCLIINSNNSEYMNLYIMYSSKKKIKDVKIVVFELKTELLTNLNHFNGITLSQFS